MNSPPVGWPVVFFPNGNPDHPLAATVTESGQQGQVKLNYQYPGGGNAVGSRGFVRHMSDPWVTERQEIIRQNGQGTWDYIPGFPPPPKPEPKKTIKKDSKDKVLA